MARNLLLITIVSLVLGALAVALAVALVWRIPAAYRPEPGAPVSHVIESVRILDPRSGTLSDPRSVLIIDGAIRRIAPSPLPDWPDSIDRIDGAGRVLMPGLIDMHVHVFDEADLAAGLAHGVTTVRNLGSFPFHQPLARRIAAGQVIGPRLITTGPIINERDGRNANLLQEFVSGADEARAAVQRQYAAGYRDLKLYSNLSRESFDAIRSEADALGMTMSGHPVEGSGSDPISFEATLAAGFATIEHTESIVWHALADETDPDLAGELAQTMAAAGVTVDPTLVVHENLSRIVETRGTHITRPDMAGFNPVVFGFERETYDFWASYPHDDRSRMQAFYIAFTGRMHAAGVRLTVGSDSGVMATPHGVSTVREIELLVEAGLTPMEALRAATVNGADALGLAGEIGCVAVGCRADLLLIDGDPLSDLALLYQPAGVMRDGVWLDRDALDRLAGASRHPSVIRTWWRLARHLLEVG